MIKKKLPKKTLLLLITVIFVNLLHAQTTRLPYVPAYMAYWLPYGSSDDIMALKDIPPAVNVLTLFAGGLHAATGDGALDIGLAVSGPRKDWEKILDTIHLMQAKGTKVILSVFVNDWTNAPANFDYDAFALSVKKKVLDTWKLDGIDLDIEGHAVNANTYRAVNSLAKYFGPKSGTAAILSAVVYESTGFNVLRNTSAVYDFVSTMDYWSVANGSNQATFTRIIDAGIPAGRILFGVSAEPNFRSTNTPANVARCVAWNPAQGAKGGMMVFDIGGDYRKGFRLNQVIAANKSGGPVTNKTTGSNNKQIIVYPNPAKRNTNVGVMLPANTSGTFRLYGPNGRLVYSKEMTAGNNSIVLSRLLTGVYSYTLTDRNNKIQTGKLVITE